MNIFPKIWAKPPWMNMEVNAVYICGKNSGVKYIDLKPRPPKHEYCPAKVPQP
jgi:hypothetical protein